MKRRVRRPRAQLPECNWAVDGAQASCNESQGSVCLQLACSPFGSHSACRSPCLRRRSNRRWGAARSTRKRGTPSRGPRRLSRGCGGGLSSSGRLRRGAASRRRAPRGGSQGRGGLGRGGRGALRNRRRSRRRRCRWCRRGRVGCRWFRRGRVGWRGRCPGCCCRRGGGGGRRRRRWRGGRVGHGGLRAGGGGLVGAARRGL